MTEISELESRITAALDRIRAGVKDLSVAAPAAEAAPVEVDDRSDRIAELEAQLAAEKEAKSQLEERVKALKDRQDGMVADLTAKVEAAKTQSATFEEKLEELRIRQVDLSEASQKLRIAAVNGSTEAELINRAMAAELDAIKALRSAEAEEVGAILNELKPIIEGAK